MNEKEFKTLVELIEGAGHEPRSYSGRGMNGKECLGVSFANPPQLILDIIANVLLNDFSTDETLGIISSLRAPVTDSMGLGMIVYWPRIAWIEGVVTVYEDEE